MSEVVPETIDVRSDERFDEQRVADYLRDKLEGADAPLAVRQFGGGHANLTYLLRFGESGKGEGADDVREYVLRRPPLGPVAAKAHDMHREYSVLSKLWQAYEPAPHAFHYCPDPEIIGADFLVMERRSGVVVRNVIPPEFGGGDDPVANRKLSEVVIGELATLHAVDPEPIGLGAIGKPEGFFERQVRGWAGRFERARTEPIPVADEVASWLLERLPVSPQHTLVHNDWKLDNMAVSADDPGHCTAVYDWDMCTLGDPLCDLGTVLAIWTDRGEGFAGALSMPTQTEGFMSRAEAAEYYAARSGRDLSGIDYYIVFGTFKLAVVLQQIYVRFARGQTQDERFAGMGKVARTLFELAADRRASVA